MKYLMRLLFALLLSLSSFAWATDSYTQQQMPFGEVELISCTTALRTHAPVYLGLAITPQTGWQIQAVDIQASSTPKVPITTLTPFKQPFQHISFYPISAVIPNPNAQTVTFDVTGSISACTAQSCQTEKLHLDHTLTNGKPMITPECYGLSLALANTPIPMYMQKIKGWAIQQADGQVAITLDFPQTPRTIQFFNNEKQPLDLELQTLGKRVQFLWTTDAQEIRLFARTYYHYYEIILPLLPQGTPVPMQRELDFDTLQAIFLFFLFSAFPIFWARTTEIKLAIFKKQTKLVLWLILFCGAVGLALWHTHPNLDLAYMPFSKGWTLTLMTLALVLIPAYPISAFLFTFIAPKPYLAALTLPFNQLIFIIGATLFTALCFATQLIWPKQIYKKLHTPNNISPLWWIFRIPWLALMIYTLIYL